MIKGELKEEIYQAIIKVYPALRINLDEIVIEATKNTKFGDLSSNIGFRMAKITSETPESVAEKIFNYLFKHWPKKLNELELYPCLSGYLNFKLKDEYYQKALDEIIRKKSRYGDIDDLKNNKIQIEFISANPTGPLTLANGRGGFGGDVLANIYQKAGAKVEREYLVNDGGNQVKILGDSVLVAAGLSKETEVYRGEYVDEWAQEYRDKTNELREKPKQLGQAIASDILEKQIKKSIINMKIVYDNWFSEQSFVESGEVEKVLASLEKKGLTFKKDKALWLRTSKFGDDKDRVLIKADGEKTYFANDIAYHWDKFAIRHFDKVVNLWGADHHGYIGRMQAATEAMGFEGQLEIVLMQLVRLIQDGNEIRMSKREGNYVTMDELFEMIGGSINEASDVARFFFLSRSFNTHMDFDLSLAKERSDKNPVFYVKYAYARTSSIIKKAEEIKLPVAKDTLLNEKYEIALIKELIKLPEILQDIINDKNYPVHYLTFYAQEIATKFHAFYDKCRVINEDDRELTAARLKLVKATQIVLQIIMEDLIGINAPEKM